MKQNNRKVRTSDCSHLFFGSYTKRKKMTKLAFYTDYQNKLMQQVVSPNLATERGC